MLENHKYMSTYIDRENNIVEGKLIEKENIEFKNTKKKKLPGHHTFPNKLYYSLL